MIINPFVFGGGAPWTPAELTLRAWYDLSDTATVTVVSSAVSAVADKSGNGFTLTQGTAANRPAYTGTLNGLNVATFDGSNDQLNAAVALAGTTHSLFIVFKPTIEAATGSLFGQWAAGQTGRFLLSTNQNCSGTASAGRFNPFNGSTTAGACGGGGAGFMADFAISNTATLVESICTTGSEAWKFYKNGVETDSATVTAVYGGVNSAFGSVSASALSNPFDGQLAEAIFLATTATTDERQRTEGYLAHKWGFASDLDAGHPYKSTPPLLPVSSVTWNPSNKSAAITLSGGNLIATHTATSEHDGVTATLGRSAGKYYFEVRSDSSTTDGLIGVAGAGFNLDNYLGLGSTEYSYYQTNGQKVNNGSAVAYGAAYTTPAVIGVAVDLDAGKIWFAKDNTWQASGNPAAGTGEAYSGMTGEKFPAITMFTNGSSMTARFKSSDFTYSPPTGFLPWQL